MACCRVNFTFTGGRRNKEWPVLRVCPSRENNKKPLSRQRFKLRIAGMWTEYSRSLAVVLFCEDISCSFCIGGHCRATDIMAVVHNTQFESQILCIPLSSFLRRLVDAISLDSL